MKNATKITVTIIILGLFAALGMLSYKYYPIALDFFQNTKTTQQQAPKADKDNVRGNMKTGAILPLTGNLSFLGTPGRNAIGLFKRLHPESGLDIRLYDSNADPKTAISQFRRAYDFDGVRFFITTLTGVSLGVKPVAIENKAFQACIAIYPGLSTGSPLVFQTCYNAIAEAECLVNYIKDKAINRLFLFASRDAVTEVEVNKYIIPPLRKNGVTVLMENFDVGTKDFRQIVAKFKASGASHALLLGYGSDFQGILRELANQKLVDKVRLIGGIGYLELPNYITYDLVENSVFVSPEFLARKGRNESYLKFKAEYKKAFGIVPTYDAAYTYDTLLALSTAMNNVTRLSPASVAAYLENHTIPGVTGAIAFTASGQLKVAVEMACYDKDLNITPIKQ